MRLNEVVVSLKDKQCHYNQGRLSYTLSQMDYAKSLTRHYTYNTEIARDGLESYSVLQSHIPSWCDDEPTYYINTHDLPSGLFKSPFITYVIQGEEIKKDCCVMLRYSLYNDRVTEYKLYQSIENEYRANNKLGYCINNMEPQVISYSHFDRESESFVKKKDCFFPVKYLGPDLVAVANQLKLTPDELYWFFEFCYKGIYQEVCNLHNNHNLWHLDIKADNIALDTSGCDVKSLMLRLIDFGLAHDIKKGCALNQYGDLEASGRLLAQLFSFCESGFSSHDQKIIWRHLDRLKASPVNSQATYWRYLIDESKSVDRTRHNFFDFEDRKHQNHEPALSATRCTI